MAAAGCREHGRPEFAGEGLAGGAPRRSTRFWRGPWRRRWWRRSGGSSQHRPQRRSGSLRVPRARARKRPGGQRLHTFGTFLVLEPAFVRDVLNQPVTTRVSEQTEGVIGGRRGLVHFLAVGSDAGTEAGGVRVVVWPLEAVRRHHAALDVPCGEVNQVETLL